MYSRLRIVGWYLAACLAATAAAVAAAAPAGPAARAGGLSLSDCQNCQEKVKFVYECYHVLQGTAPCATTVCIENELRWAACDEKKPPHDKGECKMKVKGDEPRWLQRPIESKTGLTCTDNDWEPVGDRVPKDGKCQSPGITFGTGKCWLDKKCGDKVIPPGGGGIVQPYNENREVGRLICSK